MRRFTAFAALSLAVVLAAPFVPALAAAEETASIQILSPKDGARLDAGEAYPLEYAVVPGPGGDHFHVWVDAERGTG